MWACCAHLHPGCWLTAGAGAHACRTLTARPLPVGAAQGVQPCGPAAPTCTLATDWRQGPAPGRVADSPRAHSRPVAARRRCAGRALCTHADMLCAHLIPGCWLAAGPGACSCLVRAYCAARPSAPWLLAGGPGRRELVPGARPLRARLRPGCWPGAGACPCLVRAHSAPVCALLWKAALRGTCAHAGLLRALLRPGSSQAAGAGVRSGLLRAHCAPLLRPTTARRRWLAEMTPVRAFYAPTCIPSLAAVLRGAGAARICCDHLLRGGAHLGVALTVRARCAPTCSPADSASQLSGHITSSCMF